MCKVFFFFCQNVYYIGIITLMLQKTHYNLICDLEKCKGKPCPRISLLKESVLRRILNRSVESIV